MDLLEKDVEMHFMTMDSPYNKLERRPKRGRQRVALARRKKAGLVSPARPSKIK
jgi:hypothetical protein